MNGKGVRNQALGYVLSLFYLFFFLINHGIQECAEMIWAQGACDMEGCGDNTDRIMENNRKEHKMSAELCAAI